MHNGPLWQYFLATFFVVFVVYRAISSLLGLQSEPGTLIWIGYALQALVGAFVAVGIWRGRRWVIAPLFALGALAIATIMIETFILGLQPAIFALGQSAAAVLVLGGWGSWSSTSFDRARTIGSVRFARRTIRPRRRRVPDEWGEGESSNGRTLWNRNPTTNGPTKASHAGSATHSARRGAGNSEAKSE